MLYNECKMRSVAKFLLFVVCILVVVEPIRGENGLRKFANIFKRITRAETETGNAVIGADEDDWIRQTTDILEKEVFRRVSTQVHEIERELKRRGKTEVEQRLDRARGEWKAIIEDKLRGAEHVHAKQLEDLRRAHIDEVDKIRREKVDSVLILERATMQAQQEVMRLHQQLAEVATQANDSVRNLQGKLQDHDIQAEKFKKEKKQLINMAVNVDKKLQNSDAVAKAAQKQSTEVIVKVEQERNTLRSNLEKYIDAALILERKTIQAQADNNRLKKALTEAEDKQKSRVDLQKKLIDMGLRIESKLKEQEAASTAKETYWSKEKQMLIQTAINLEKTTQKVIRENEQQKKQLQAAAEEKKKLINMSIILDRKMQEQNLTAVTKENYYLKEKKMLIETAINLEKKTNQAIAEVDSLRGKLSAAASEKKKLINMGIILNEKMNVALHEIKTLKEKLRVATDKEEKWLEERKKLINMSLIMERKLQETIAEAAAREKSFLTQDDFTKEKNKWMEERKKLINQMIILDGKMKAQEATFSLREKEGQVRQDELKKILASKEKQFKQYIDASLILEGKTNQALKDKGELQKRLQAKDSESSNWEDDRKFLQDSIVYREIRMKQAADDIELLQSRLNEANDKEMETSRFHQGQIDSIAQYLQAITNQEKSLNKTMGFIHNEVKGLNAMVASGNVTLSDEMFQRVSQQLRKLESDVGLIWNTDVHSLS